MPAGPSRRARRAAEGVAKPPPPVEFTREELDVLDRLSRRMARRFDVPALLGADDLFQEGAMAIVRKIRRGEAAPGLFFVVARNAMRDAYHKAVRSRAEVAAEVVRGSAGRARPALDADEILDVRLAVEGLPPDQRDVVRLHGLAGMSQTEAAAAIGTSRDAVQFRLGRAKQALRGGLGSAWADEWGRSVPIRNPEAWKCRARRINRPRKSRGGSRGGTVSHRQRIASRFALIDQAAEAELRQP